MTKPTNKCAKHKRTYTIWYRNTDQLICSKCGDIIIKAKKIKK